MYLSPFGAGTIEQTMIRPVIFDDKVNRFCAEMVNEVNEVNFTVINPSQRTITS
jgi:hypothetical protein